MQLFKIVLNFIVNKFIQIISNLLEVSNHKYLKANIYKQTTKRLAILQHIHTILIIYKFSMKYIRFLYASGVLKSTLRMHVT